jgi:hypothetical protein
MTETLINPAFLAFVAWRFMLRLFLLCPPDFQAFPHNTNDSTQHERNIDGYSEDPWTAGAEIIGA